MDGLESEFEGSVQFRRLDAAEAENVLLQQEYGLRGHPTVAILDGEGMVVQRYFGAESAETLRQALLQVTNN